jgi:hypothetical protein
MRLAERGRRCPIHADPETLGTENVYLRKSACKCVSVPSGRGWERKMVEVSPGCVYHRSVLLGPKDVAPWARKEPG